MQNYISVGISLPRKIMKKIDVERGDISRSRYLLRLERTYVPDKVDHLTGQKKSPHLADSGK
jgi:metal-responsive CopG/Arc/MetJ family transcriptional regulator